MNRFPIQSLPALAFRLMFLAVALSIVTGCNNKTPASAEVKGPRSVVVSAVEEQKLQTSLTMPAELTPFESVAIYPKETGFLQWIGVDRGSRVHKGQLLVRITAPEVDARRAQGQAQLQAADSQLTATQAKLASDEATSNHLEDAAKTPGVVAGNDLLVAEKTVEADRANAKAAEENVNSAKEALNSYTTMLEYLQVTAPFDGMITERNVHPGALVGPAIDSATSIPMLRLETTDHMRLNVPVPQAYLSGIQGGQKVEFKVPAYPDRTFTGTIARISDSVDRQTRTMPVELDVWNRDGLLTPGTYAQVEWPIHRVGTSLVVPKTAVASDLEHSFVIRVSDGKTQWVNVQVGLPKDDLVEVFGALKAGDLVVARATDELRPDTAVVPVHEAER